MFVAVTNLPPCRSSFVTDCSAVLSPSNASASMDILDGEEEVCTPFLNG